MGIHKRKQESKKTRRKRKQELDQESDQEKKKVFSFFLGRFLVFLIALFVEFLFSYFLVFLYKFSPQENIFPGNIHLITVGFAFCGKCNANSDELGITREYPWEDEERGGLLVACKLFTLLSR